MEAGATPIAPGSMDPLGDSRRHPALRELGILAVAGAVYFVGRFLVEGSFSRAVHNAQHLLDAERTLGIDIEADAQRFALGHDIVRLVGNFSYVWLHWPLLLSALAFLYRRNRDLYRQLRTALIVSGVLGLALFASVPMAPPRFMADHVGTVSDAARRLYLGFPLSWTNRYAAFPSFHVGWTLVGCVALARSVRSLPARLVLATPAVLVGAAVVTTGNHYILDSVAGALIALGAYWWAGRHQRAHHLSTTWGQRPCVGSPRRASINT
jgi:hypothetical protein